MTTREKCERYHILKETNPTLARNFLENNSSDERFVSLVTLGDHILSEVAGYGKAYEEMVGPISEITDPETFIEGVGNLVRNLQNPKK